MAALLEVRDLSVEYATKESTIQAVRHLDLDLRAGEVYALVGESGSGKTTVALSLLDILEYPGVMTGGTIRLAGENIGELDQGRLQEIRGASISMIFQDPVAGLNPVVEVGKQVEEVISSHRDVEPNVAREMVLEALGQMRLPDPARIAKAYPGELSGGMCQRVMIAIATVLRPKVLIADEPTSALDVTVQAQILEELRHLQEDQGTAILLITHDLGVVAQVADRVGIMYAGALVETTDYRAMFASPRHPYTWALLSTLPRLNQPRRGVLPQIRGNPPDLGALTEQCSFLERCPKALTQCRTEAEPELRLVDGKSEHMVACYNMVAEGVV